MRITFNKDRTVINNTIDPFAPNYQPEPTEPSPGWRREHPTVTEVDCWSYWWWRIQGDNDPPQIVELSADGQRGAPRVVHHVLGEWRSLDHWPFTHPEGEWAIALPPGMAQ